MMSFRRFAGVSGLVAVALGVIAAALFGNVAGANPTAREVLAWAGDNQATINVILVLLAGQLFAFAVFVVGLYGVLRSDEPPGEPWSMLGLTGGIVAGAVLAMQYVAVVPFALHFAELSEPSTLVLRDIALALNSPLAVAGAVSMLGYGVAIHRTGKLPSWLAYLAYLGTLMALVGGLAVVPTAQGSGFGIVTGIGAFLFLLWVLLVGIWILLRPAPIPVTPVKLA